MEISYDLAWFFATRIRFIEADPDPADQNETDPKHWLGQYTYCKIFKNLWAKQIHHKLHMFEKNFHCI